MKRQLEDDYSRRYPAPVTESELQVSGWHHASMEYDYSPTLRDLLEILYRRKWLIIICMIFVVVPILIYTVSQEPLYKATGSVELASRAPNVTTFEEITSNTLSGTDFIQTQVQLLTSKALALRVVEKLQLAQHPIFTQRPQYGIVVRWVKTVGRFFSRMFSAATDTLASWFQDNTVAEKSAPAGVDLSALKKQEALENYFLSNLTVSSDGSTNIVSVDFTSPDPVLSQKAVNTLLEEFINWQMDRKILAAKAAKTQLEKQIKIAWVQLEASVAKLNQFGKESGVVSLDTRLNLIYQELGEINQALANVESERIKKKEAYEQAAKSNPNESLLVLNDSLIKRLRGQYIDLRAEYEQLRVTFKKQYPAVQKLAARMQDIGQKIKVEQKHILNSVENDYLATVNIEKALRKTAEEKKALALQLNELVGRYKIIEREVETNQKIYESLLQRSKQIDANVGTDIGNIKVVDMAALPLLPEDKNCRETLPWPLF